VFRLAAPLIRPAVFGAPINWFLSGIAKSEYVAPGNQSSLCCERPRALSDEDLRRFQHFWQHQELSAR
jgi:hypothetical protein